MMKYLPMLKYAFCQFKRLEKCSKYTCKLTMASSVCYTYTYLTNISLIYKYVSFILKNTPISNLLMMSDDDLHIRQKKTTENK